MNREAPIVYELIAVIKSIFPFSHSTQEWIVCILFSTIFSIHLSNIFEVIQWISWALFSKMGLDLVYRQK